MAEPLILSSEYSFEDEIVVAIEMENWRGAAGKVCISVAQEQAVDSYNQTFNCSIHLDQHQARMLRDWLIRNVP
jgi:hypothetical protein